MSGTPEILGRRLSYVGFAMVVAGYLVVIKGLGLVAESIWDLNDRLATTRDVLISMWLPLGGALVYTYAVVAWLGWWRPVMRDDRPVQGWLWAVPVIFAVCVALAIDYADLADKPAGYVLALVVATQFVGWGEEGMFRGVGVTTLRSHGLTEGKVALWSSVVFGAVHITNALGGGAASKALPQAIAVSFAGYFFYLMRRVSRGNVLNSVIHGLFDFSILSATAIVVDQGAYIGSGATILAYLVTAILLVARRKHIEPTAGPNPPGTPGSV